MADAFTAGVAPGGLISSQHVKLMVCYILARIGKPISRDDMLSLLQYEEIANYFEVSVDVLLGDALKHNEAEINNELALIFRDCSEYEKKLILDIAKEIKKSHRCHAHLK